MKISELDLSVRTANAVCSVILGRETHDITDQDKVMIDAVVQRADELKKSLRKKQWVELSDQLRRKAYRHS